VWLEERRSTSSAKTFTADAALPRLVPTAVAALSVSAVSDREVQRALVTLTRDWYAEASVRRFRASLSSFFAWTVRERMVAFNPVTTTRVPKAASPRAEMYPFSEQELERVYARAVERLTASGRDSRLADLLLIAAWTGLRWSELRALRVRDFAEIPMPLLIVQRAEPEGTSVKAKSGRGRRVPVADRILPLVRAMAAGRHGEAPVRDFLRPPAARLRVQARPWLVESGRRSSHPRPQAHGRLPVACPRG